MNSLNLSPPLPSSTLTKRFINLNDQPPSILSKIFSYLPTALYTLTVSFSCSLLINISMAYFIHKSHAGLIVKFTLILNTNLLETFITMSRNFRNGYNGLLSIICLSRQSSCQSSLFLRMLLNQLNSMWCFVHQNGFNYLNYPI